MPDDLTPAEVAAITGKARAASQAAVLARMGVPFQFCGGSQPLRVPRDIAQAHALLAPTQAPKLQPSPPLRFVDGRPAGLIRWQNEQNELREQREKMWAEADAAIRAMQPTPEVRRLAAKRAVAAARRAARRRQCPAWADRDAIREVYAEALRLTNETGVVHHVDHELPLRGRTVSGLHVHQNLRAVPALDNMRKGNRFTP